MKGDAITLVRIEKPLFTFRQIIKFLEALC
jgi:hypothetical protein